MTAPGGPASPKLRRGCIPVSFHGTTVGGGEVDGVVPMPGGSLAPAATDVVLLRLALAGSAQLSASTGYALTVESDLEQVTLTDDSVTTLADEKAGLGVQTSLAPLLDNIVGLATKLIHDLGG